MVSTNRLASIYYLTIEPNSTFTILPDFILSNDRTLIEKFFTPDNIQFVIGLNEFHSIMNNQVFVSSDMQIDIDENTFHDRTHLITFLVLTEFFCQALWLIKDNSVQSELGHLKYKGETRYSIHSNFWNCS
jgi:hypothetical protein